MTHHLQVPAAISSRLRNLSFVCACLVVFIHVPQEGRQGTVVYQWFISILDLVLGCAVPTFFAISGAFVAVSLSRASSLQDYKAFYIKRMKTLVVPFFLLTFIVWSIAAIELSLDIRYGFSDRLSEISWESFLRAFGFGRTRSPLLGVLWYVRTLFFLVLISPVLNRLVLKGRVIRLGFLIGLAVLQCCWGCAYLRYPILQPLGYWMAPGSVLYFYAGMLWAWSGFIMPVRCWGGLILVTLVIAIARIVGLLSPIWVVFLETLVTLPAGVVALFTIVPSRSAPTLVTGNSFGIYVIHTVVLHFIMLADRLFGCWGGGGLAVYDTKLFGAWYRGYCHIASCSRNCASSISSVNGIVIRRSVK